MTKPTAVAVTDVILRDAHQSLIATRMRTEDMLPICDKLDQVGYWSLEVWGGATFDACVRFLKEDPWQRLRQLRAALPNTRLQMLLRGQNLLGYRHYADDVVEAFVAKSAENGIDVFRVFDALNDVRNLETAMKAVKKAGKHAQGTICYTTSPVHTPELFVQQAHAMRDMGADSIAIKDMAGLLTPYATYDLVKALTAELDVPVVVHSHSTAGLAPLCQLKAIEAGASHIDTAISAFANGTSHPATEAQVAALKDSPYDTGLDLALLSEIAEYFREVRKKYHQFESEFTREDVSVQINQVPGGMMSNLANQLKEQNALDKIQQVFAEIPKVRKDLGYPPLVTPTSQIVGTQAVYNVLAGQRYKTITNEVKRYLQGGYGAAPAKVNEELLKQAIGSEHVDVGRPADLLQPELNKLRADIGSLAQSEEDVLTYAMFPDLGREFLQQRAEGSLKPEELLPVASAKDSKLKQAGASEFKIAVHGEVYDVAITGVGGHEAGKRKLYLSLDGMPEEVIFEPLNEYQHQGDSGRKHASEPGHVSTTMPGNVVEVMVQVGQQVAAGQSVLVAEAMKMETEIHANIAGTVKAIHVAKGDRVTPGEVLIEIG
ncbi:sodium-extruding oxaloacetate decarboxylase subunit alpha [Dasania sp. GY-MA-18]|uniref:Sodium-extruding oxaloacetate decarboxylase subunit alpha n=1 Tax=Dasania phycosphaerae TaxID=2950436 RepID=A0A9J6RNF5_9GAMM|nr:MULTISPECIES: sodium-extruding oxaloacetate decarboxylase subunit alpha [Dasania]MCR8923828.1 sodium-extruding oxaloacetate decarboxylase subunit alpha [Dasania sp. GY-MA-18]MCZ0866262.1 sodium-extruding oxaloacetate decarboxylase subunit alpha [Dasania phycosphaerae]MCZ0869986.1 sodium-extruding oxaloacetate decarboxylase subunit alpha [Dasania phycosphaerae]